MKYTVRGMPMAQIKEGSKSHTKGDCFIIVSPPHEKRGWQLSISCKHRNPTWDEIKQAWYELIPDADTRTGVMFFPPLDEYVNVHPHCFHVHEVSYDTKKNILGEELSN